MIQRFRLLLISGFAIVIILQSAHRSTLEATDLCEYINVNTTWTFAGSPYIVTCDILIDATLTIEPGVELRFNAGKSIHIHAGKMLAVGTAGNPIVFTSSSATPAPGNWRGIIFNPQTSPSQGSSSILSYVNVLYAGGNGGSAAIELTGISPGFDHVTVSYSSTSGFRIDSASPTMDNITISNCSASGITTNANAAQLTAVLSNSVISNNGSYGINLDSGGISASNVAINNNADYGISINDYSALAAFTGSLSGNGGGTKDSIGYRGTYIPGTEAWHNVGLDWNVLSGITIDGTLTIDPGVTVKFANAKRILVRAGKIIALGTAANRINFISSSSAPTPGIWNGIWFQPQGASQGSLSRISYANITHAGGGSNGAVVISSLSPTLDHLTISDSSTSAIYGGNGGPNINNCYFQNNASGITNATPTPLITAKLNYWNASDGPGGSGPGTGQPVSTGVNFEPWLLSAPTDPQFFATAVIGNRSFNPNKSNLIINITTPLSGSWTAKFFNSINILVRTMNGTGSAATILWDGKDDGGVLQPNGTYSYQVESTAGSDAAAPFRGFAIIDTTLPLTISNVNLNPQYFSPNGDGIQDATILTATINFEGIGWTVNVKNSLNAIVRSATGQSPSVAFTWDGRDGAGALQPDGVYTFEIVASDGTTATRTGILDNDIPAAIISGPGEGILVSNVYQNGSTNVNITGTATDQNLSFWQVDYGVGPSPGSWTVLASNSSSVNGGTFVSMTETLANGVYTIRLQVFDLAGNRNTVTSTFTIGNFSMSSSILEFNAPSGGSTSYTSFVPFTVSQTLVVKNEQGQTVKTIFSGTRSAGTYIDTWNGRNDSGSLLPDGPYFYSAQVADGSSSMNWDQSNFYLPLTWQCAYPTITNFDPFNNLPVRFDYNFSITARLILAFSPTFIASPPGVPPTCDPPNYCVGNRRYEEGGPHSVSWAGIDNTGAFRADMKGFSLCTQRLQFSKNAVVVYGTKPVITGALVTVNPSYFNPGSSNQTVNFSFSSYQNQTVNVKVEFQNYSSLSVLRTINMTGVSPGAVSVPWDGKADNGMWVAPGAYIVTATITDSIGNQASAQILTTIAY